MNDLKQKFDEARKEYKGNKRGLDEEWENFVKICNKHKLNKSEVIPLLKPAVIKEELDRGRKIIAGIWVPPTRAYFRKWIHDRRWTTELEKIPNVKACVVCGATENLKYGLDLKNRKIHICETDLENIRKYDRCVNWARLPASHIKRLAELGACK